VKSRAGTDPDARRRSVIDPAETRIVLLAIAGDEASFQELVLRHQGWVRSLARRSLTDAGTADDVAQEAFLKAWRKLTLLRDPAVFGPWLRRIVVNAIVDRLRLRSDWETASGDDPIEAPASRFADTEARLDLQSCLARLTPAQRLCILMVHGEGMTHREVAEETGLPIGTVKSHVARATPLLRRWLAPWDTGS
jgi:RNA polymerase sigma factor (sigma-70 family)